MIEDLKRLSCRLCQNHPMGVLLVGIGLLHVLVNLQFSGPTYPADEIGYLFNALVMAGASIEGASSYHVGYALFLVPIFALQLGDWGSWIGIVLLNTAFVLSSLYLLDAILKQILTDQTGRLWAIGLCGIYPSAIAFTGYAFAQPAITFFFILACYSLVRTRGSELQNLTVFGAAVGFLYWIHPTALAIAIAASLTLVARTYVLRSTLLPTAIAIFMMIGLALLHKLVAHPAIVDAMASKDLSNQLHYPKITAIFSQIANLDALARIAVRASGQILYLVLATLGLFAVGVYVMLMQMRQDLAGASKDGVGRSTLFGFILLSLLGVSTMSAMMFEAIQANWATHFFYGRYLETMVFVPLAIAIMTWPKRQYEVRIASAAALAVFAGIFALITNYDRVDWLMVHGFFQLAATNYAVPAAFLLAAGTVYVVNSLERTLQLKILAGLFAIGTFKALAFHKGEWQGRSAPTELPKLVRDAFPDASCVAYHPVSSLAPWIPPKNEQESRRNLIEPRVRAYGYYLRDYAVRRMSIAQWREHCDGPYLTADRSIIEPSDKIVAMEKASGIMVVGRQPFQTTENYRGIVLGGPQKSARIISRTTDRPSN